MTTKFFFNMSFKEMKFKDAKVFVEVDDAGEIIVEQGRALMKYSLKSDKVYKPNPKNLVPVGADVEEGTLLSDSTPPPPKKKAAVMSGKISVSGEIVAYTDGACSGNPGPAGLGYVITYPDGSCVQRGEPLGNGTNNIAELTAILRVLEVVDDPSQKVVIHTDSAYSIGVLVKGWKAKANRKLISRIRTVLDSYSNVELRKVKGHAGVPQNELVDDLARRAAETQRPVSE